MKRQRHEGFEANSLLDWRLMELLLPLAYKMK